MVDDWRTTAFNKGRFYGPAVRANSRMASLILRRLIGVGVVHEPWAHHGDHALGGPGCQTLLD